MVCLFVEVRFREQIHTHHCWMNGIRAQRQLAIPVKTCGANGLVVFLASEGSKNFSIICYAVKQHVSLFERIRKKEREREREYKKKQVCLPSQTCPQNPQPARSLHRRYDGWSTLYSFEIGLPDWRSTTRPHPSFICLALLVLILVNLCKFENSQTRQKCPPSLWTAGVSPSVAGAATTGVRPAHG